MHKCSLESVEDDLSIGFITADAHWWRPARSFFFEALVIGLFAMERMHSKGLIDANFDSHPALKIWSGGSMFYIDAAQVPDRRGLILIWGLRFKCLLFTPFGLLWDKRLPLEDLPIFPAAILVH